MRPIAEYCRAVAVRCIRGLGFSNIAAYRISIWQHAMIERVAFVKIAFLPVWEVAISTKNICMQ